MGSTQLKERIMQANFIERIVKAHKVGTPLVVVTTADPRAMSAKVAQNVKHYGEDVPCMTWDVASGINPVIDPHTMEPANEVSQEMVAKLKGSVAQSNDGFEALGDGDDDPTAGDPMAFLRLCPYLEDGNVVFVFNAQRYMSNPAFLQSVWNLRDSFKFRRVMMIMVGPDIEIPAELKNDVYILDEPLPNREELEKIVDVGHTYEDGEEEKTIPCTSGKRSKIVDAITGLSHFGASQALAISMSKQGADLEILKETKRRVIRTTPGLEIYSGGETFSDAAGLDYLKEFMTQVLQSKRSPKIIVWLDEIEKALAGSGTSGGDTSGVSQDFLGTLLSYTEDHNCNGSIFYGPPGCSKSLTAKAIGGEGGIDTIRLDLGAMKGSLVGQSQQNLRQALRVIQAASLGQSYWIATCNSVSTIPAALIRRFTHGIIYFDLPDAEEREAIWKVQMKAHNLTKQQTTKFPHDEGWSGADIRNCCRLADDFGQDVLEASKWINPVSVSDPSMIAEYRENANGRYKSATTGEIYRFEPAKLGSSPRKRKMEV